MNISSYSNAIKFISNKKYKKCLLISGKNSYYKSGASQIFDSCFEKKQCIKYFKKKFIPEFLELKNIIKIIQDFNPDLIIAIGGGTVIDYAKSANCLNIKIKKEDIKTGKITFRKKASLCTIPTTAGSGAEVTENAVIYIDKIKYSVENKLIKPDYFFLIPELVLGLKFKLKATSGFDAIAQGIESILSIKSNIESLKYSKKSLDYSFQNFQKYLESPNINNTSGMCLAANLSGKAISITKTIAPHALSYPFTSLYNIPHGHAVSLTLNHFIKFNYINMNKADKSLQLKKKFEILFKASKTKSINEFCNYLDYLKKAAKLEGNLKKLNINLESDFDRIIKGVNFSRLKNNPIEISFLDIKKILNLSNK